MSPLAVAPVARTYYHWPHRWEIVGWGAWDAVSGTALVRTQSSANITGGRGGESAGNADDGDTCSFYVPLDSGTYSFMWMWQGGTSAGIFDVTLGGAAIASGVDLYQAGGGTANSVTTVTGITVAIPGVKTLTFTANGKNASSSDYQRSIQLITLVRTGS